MFHNRIFQAAMFGVLPMLLLTSGCRHKYDNPITKDTQQPDKVLFDTAIDDIEKGRYDRARLTLQTMMNTYDTSEFLAKAKLAMADSWRKEGGAHGMAQAEAEYKDFILFYPNMEESAEAQAKICNMQYQQMDKADRDPVHARLADAECKVVLQQWPNSKFAPEAARMLREVQEVLADMEMKVGVFYLKRGGNAYFSSANRLNSLVDQFPIYSRADEALWLAADGYNQLGDRFENKQAEMYTRIVRDYPLSAHAEDAKAQLKAMNRPVPASDPVAEARMKFELENRTKQGILSKVTGPFASSPNTRNAAKSGDPNMEVFKPTIPMGVPATAIGGATTNEVTLTTPNADLLDKGPDARPASATPATATPATATPAADATADKPADAAAAAAAATPSTVSGKKLKPPKPPAEPKKRAKPSDQKKSTVPPKQSGGGEAPKQ